MNHVKHWCETRITKIIPPKRYTPVKTHRYVSSAKIDMKKT